MEGTEDDGEASLQEDQLDKNILAFVADSSDENEEIVQKGGGNRKKPVDTSGDIAELVLKKKSSSTESGE